MSDSEICLLQISNQSLNTHTHKQTKAHLLCGFVAVVGPAVRRVDGVDDSVVVGWLAVRSYTIVCLRNCVIFSKEYCY